MAKLTAATLQGGYLSVDALNAWLAALSEALDNTVSRDGSAPNYMEADLDLNGYRLLNSGESDDPSRVITYDELIEYVDSHASGLIVTRIQAFVATAGQTVFNLTGFDYEVGVNNIAVYVNGVRVFTPDFVETDTDTITFAAGLNLNDDVQFVQNEYLSTTSVEAHTHPWSQITNLPDYATRWPTWDEVTGKPATFTASAHNHAASEITSGRVADARRGVYVQAAEPTGQVEGDIWAW